MSLRASTHFDFTLSSDTLYESDGEPRNAETGQDERTADQIAEAAVTGAPNWAPDALKLSVETDPDRAETGDSDRLAAGLNVAQRSLEVPVTFCRPRGSENPGRVAKDDSQRPRDRRT